MKRISMLFKKKKAVALPSIDIVMYSSEEQRLHPDRFEIVQDRVITGETGYQSILHRLVKKKPVVTDETTKQHDVRVVKKRHTGRFEL